MQKLKRIITYFRRFIGRNLAWFGLSMFLREELRVLGDPGEALVLLPSSASLLQKFGTPGPENTKWKVAPVLHVLFPGGERIPKAFQRLRSDSDVVA